MTSVVFDAVPTATEALLFGPMFLVYAVRRRSVRRWFAGPLARRSRQ